VTDADVNKLIKLTSSVRKIPAESLNFYRDMMLGDVVNGPRGKTATNGNPANLHLRSVI